MNPLPKNVRVGRNGRIGILKKIPRDLWQHPAYAGKSKIVERSTGSTSTDEGIRIAVDMLARLEDEFSRARAELSTSLPSADISEPPTAPSPAARKRKPVQSRAHVAEETRRDIINVAMKEFAEKGLSGARVDEIAAKTRTTKPTIYYHFGSKEKLYAAVMEEAYGEVRNKEQGLHLDDLPPVEALQKLVEVTFDHHAAHTEHVRLVCVENIERGRHISGRSSLVQRNAIAIETVRKLLARGERAGVFREGINPWHFHLLITSFCFIRVSNRYTWNAVFEMDLWREEDVPKQRQMIIEAILRYVRPGP
ncbi:TetR/AcrR family transcriptional regulator [Propionivibrio dicarboxylicus]|uniref:Transcriptional regulator, TetR family n=1 Tax=Propionivibrio dicarboxylicus TaxID=83767 RepID=A0A1G8EXW1_9RHOO|nr:TetR/AcrR family transcriptional regulator [Propionivibrio dicarboxylicus]SDH74751.1 transcriptional regulator, TetR family [Propionivibrio dicarboxylicus]